MSKGALEKKLEALRALRQSGDARAGVIKALGDSSNYVVSKGADLCAELGLRELAPDLVSAFQQLMQAGVKGDPQCWGKTAIAKALADMAWRAPEVFVSGLRHRQLEASVGRGDRYRNGLASSLHGGNGIDRAGW